MPPLPSATPTWHNDTYEAISPHRAELSAAGKTVIVIGAGSGIGRETAKAFSDAQAAHIVLLGRHEASLKDTAALLNTEPEKVTVHTTDVVQQKSLEDVAASIGTWDILVNCSGYVSQPSTMTAADVDEWWQSFETNVKGTFLTIRAFIPTANKAGASFLAVTTGTAALPPVMLPELSGYISSKLAQIKVVEYLAAENHNLFAATIHPGLVETYLFKRSGSKAENLPMDKVQLPAHFLVWMASPEAAFLKGRSVWANWDVEELKTQAQSIASGLQMTSGINGWPYPNM